MFPYNSTNYWHYMYMQDISLTFDENELTAIKSIGELCHQYPTLLYGIARNENRATMHKILDIIIDDTLIEGKPFRVFDTSRFTIGKSFTFQHACLTSGSTVRRILKNLVESNVVYAHRYFKNSYILGMNFKILIDHLISVHIDLEDEYKNNPNCANVLDALRQIYKYESIFNFVAFRISTLTD